MDIYLRTTERYLLNQMNVPVSEDAMLYRLSLLERKRGQRQQTRFRWLFGQIIRNGSLSGGYENIRKVQEMNMSKEKSMILKMLSRGKISSEEAVTLLEALGEEPVLEEALKQAANEENPVAASDEPVQEDAVSSERDVPGFEYRRVWRLRPRFPDPSYAAAIKRLGVDFTSEQLIDLEMAEISAAEVEDLLTVRRQEWALEDLVSMLVHRVTRQIVLEFHELGMGDLSPKNLVEFAIHRVTPALVRRARQAGFADLEPGTLVEFCIHKVDFEMIEAARALGPVNEEDAVNMSIHGVTAAYIQAMSKAFPEIRLRQILEMRIHKVTPRYLAAMHDLELKDLTPDLAVEMKIHGVDPGEAGEFKQLLGADLTASSLVEFAIHHVTPDYAQGIFALGLDCLSPDHLVAMQIHGVSLEAARRAKELHGEKLTPQKLEEMAIFGHLP